MDAPTRDFFLSRIERPGLAAVVGGAAGLATAGAVVALGPYAITPMGLAVVFGALFVVSGDKADAADNKADDPARSDYEVETTVETSTDVVDLFGGSSLERAAAELVELAMRVVAYERAMVLADERVLGAREAGDEVAAAARREEARIIGTAAADLNQGLRARAETLASSLEEERGLRVAIEQLASDAAFRVDVNQFLPDAALVRLKGGGLDLDRATRSITRAVRVPDELARGQDPIGALAQALRIAGKSSGVFGIEWFRRGDAAQPAPYQSYRVTPVDLTRGRIRIPVGDKDLFPTDRARIAIRLRGALLRGVAWNPGLRPGREQPGEIHIGHRLRELVGPNEVLEIQPVGEIPEFT